MEEKFCNKLDDIARDGEYNPAEAAEIFNRLRESGKFVCGRDFVVENNEAYFTAAARNKLLQELYLYEINSLGTYSYSLGQVADAAGFTLRAALNLFERLKNAGAINDTGYRLNSLGDFMLDRENAHLLSARLSELYRELKRNIDTRRRAMEKIRADVPGCVAVEDFDETVRKRKKRLLLQIKEFELWPLRRQSGATLERFRVRLRLNPKFIELIKE